MTIKGELLRTEDGDKSRHTISANTIGGFAGASFIDSQRGWAVSNHGEVWRSIDGGGTWNPIGKLEAKQAGDWYFNSAVKIGFVDELHGWIVESLSIWRTQDGGKSWEEVFSTILSDAKGQPTGASFLNAMKAWVSGTDQPVFNYRLYSTVLGGQLIAGIAPNGQKTLGNVYDGDGALLALGDANGVEWQHVDLCCY